MASIIDTQTIALDQYPATPLDQFPDALQRQPLAEIGLDGITDAMVSSINLEPFTEHDRASSPWTTVK